MAEFLHFSRDTKMYLVKDNAAWTLPVLDGFSFSQATNASEITLNEMEDASGRSRRGRKMFTDSLSAAEWSFSTYTRPFKAAGGTTYNSGVGRADSAANKTHAVEEALWICMGSKNVYNAAGYNFKHGSVGGALTSIVITTGATDSDRTAGTYIIAIPTTGATAKQSVVVAAGAGSNTGGTSAVVTVVVNGSGTATATITDRGIGFDTGNTITIGAQLIGGGAGDDNLVLTATSEAFTSDTTDLDINFFDSNRSSLATFDIYFILSDKSKGRLVYKCANSAVNEATIDFDIDGIATINWSGFAGQVTDVTATVSAVDSAPNASAAGEIWIDTNDSDSFYVSTASGTSNWAHTIDEGTTSTNNFIRNRLTQLTLAPDATFKANNTGVTYENDYQVAITGGNITISNNISYLTPEELGRVNQPIEHVTGTRTVTGSFTCYLGSSDAATNKSKNLFEDLVQDTETVINEFELKFDVGGTTGTPRLEFAIDRCHLEIPSHSIDDVISLETNFHGLGSSIGEADEITIKYVGA